MTAAVATLSAHPYADVFPMLPETDLADLAESIRTSGLRQPIVLTTDGLILDGRNRAAACALLGVEPETVIYQREDLAEYVIDCNVTRRSMTTGARAMATAVVLASDGRREGGRWVGWSRTSQDSGKSSGEREALRCAGIVLDYLPDLAPEVIAGTASLHSAYEQAELIRTSAERDKIEKREREKREKKQAAEEAARDAKIVADLSQSGPKYLSLIDSGSLTPVAAWAAHLEDTRKDRQAAEEIERGIRDTNVRVAECVRSLDAQSPGEAFLRGFYPHHGRVVVEGMQLNRERITNAITFLTNVLKETDR